MRNTCSRHAPSLHATQVQGPGTPSRTFHLESTTVCSFVFRHWCSQRTKRLDNQVAPECGLHHPGITSAPLWSSARTNRADGNVGQHREETVCVQGGRPVLGRLRHPKPRMYPFWPYSRSQWALLEGLGPKVRRGI